MNEELRKRAEQNKINELERLEKIRKLCNKLTDEFQDRLKVIRKLYVGYLIDRVVICENNSIIADIWHGFFSQVTENVIISSLSFEEMEIIFELCKLTK